MRQRTNNWHKKKTCRSCYRNPTTSTTKLSSTPSTKPWTSSGRTGRQVSQCLGAPNTARTSSCMHLKNNLKLSSDPSRKSSWTGALLERGRFPGLTSVNLQLSRTMARSLKQTNWPAKAVSSNRTNNMFSTKKVFSSSERGVLPSYSLKM